MFKKISLILLTIVLMTACVMTTACKKSVYTVTFDTDGGTTVAQQRIEEGAKATKPEDPTKIGYEFDDWYWDETGNPFDFEATSIGKNITLTAKWNINQYSITFDSDGGTAIDTITQDYNTSVTKPSDPTKTGYAFNGWYEDGSETAYEFDTIEARDVSLKANWIINQYSITFDSDGGSAVETITQVYNTSVTAPTDPEKIGYTFNGWFESTSIIPYQFNLIEARNVSLKAAWKINQYSITFDTDGGTPTNIDAITQDYNTSVTAPSDPTKTGYTFNGWYEDGSETAYEFDTIEARDVSLKANWIINQYSITFDSDGGTAVETITQDYNTTVNAPTTPTKPGYNFVGWFEENAQTPYNFSKIEARDVALKATWSEREKHSINFNSDGGSTVATITEKAGMPVTAPVAPTKTGYSFAGWFEEGAIQEYVFDVIEERTVNLKAKWDINQYSIIFDTDGGSVIDTITQDYNTTVTAPSDPTKDGYHFLGWYEEGSGTAYEFNLIEARNVTLKAKWAEIRGVITLDKGLQGLNVTGLTQSVINAYIGQEIAITDLSCWGYKFLGWKNLSTGETLEKVDGEYKFIHDGNDVTYQAQWQKISVDSDIV